MGYLSVAEHRWVPVSDPNHPAYNLERKMSALELMVWRHGRSPTAAVAESPVLAPVVSHGRWLIRCPFCPSACHASRIDLRFRCVVCMADTDPWLPVVWPPEANLVESVLLRRPRIETQNWRAWDASEPALALESENAIYGVS